MIKFFLTLFFLGLYISPSHAKAASFCPRGTPVTYDGSDGEAVFATLTKVPLQFAHVQGQFHLWFKQTEAVKCSYLETNPVSCIVCYPIVLKERFVIQPDGSFVEN